MPPQRTQPAARAVKTERTHEENQERAYIAASRRSDRSIEARVESARRASEIHKKRTGRALRVTEQDVVNEDMYEEEDDELPRQMRHLTQHFHTNSVDFNEKLANFVITHFGSMQAANDAIQRAEITRIECERTGQPPPNFNVAAFMPPGFQNTVGLQNQMALQQQQLFGHPIPQHYMTQNMAPRMMHLNPNQQMNFGQQTPYGMQPPQHMQGHNQQLMNHQFSSPQPPFNNGMNNQMQHNMQQNGQQMQVANGGNGNLQIPVRGRSGSHSIHSNSPLPPAQSPALLTPAKTNERRVSATSAATPMPSIEEESDQNSLPIRTHQPANRAPSAQSMNNKSRSNNSSSSRGNEFLPLENSADQLLSMPDYQYGVSADIFATPTPGPQQGGSGFFEPQHFAHGFNGNDPLSEMFKMGSTGQPFENDLNNSYSTNMNYGVKQEQTAQEGNMMPPKQGNAPSANAANTAVNSYLGGMEDGKMTGGGMEGGDEAWNDWTEGGDYHNEQVGK